MDRASEGLRFEGSTSLPPGFDPSVAGPLDRPTAIALIRHADELMEASEPEHALALYGRTIGASDKDISAAALYGMGNALYRLDRDGEALGAWERVTTLGENPGHLPGLAPGGGRPESAAATSAARSTPTASASGAPRPRTRRRSHPAWGGSRKRQATSVPRAATSPAAAAMPSRPS